MAASQEYKKQKKLWNKGRRKAVRPFKGLTIFFAIVLIIGIVATYVLDLYAMTMKLLLGGVTYEIVDGDDSAQYYTSDYSSEEERIEVGSETAYQVEAEGVTLLKNENDALPLESGAKVTLFGYGSVDLTYGGTGSGGIDTDSAGTLKDGFEEAGIEVNETVWDFYETGAGSADESEAATATIADEDTEYSSDEPSIDAWSDTEWESVADYDTAIFVISRIGGEGADLPSDTSDAESGGYLGLSNNERELLQQLASLKEEGTISKIIVLLNSSNSIQLDFVDDEAYGVDAVMYIGGVGGNGIAAVADCLLGNVNPSGHLADTYLADNTSSPAMVNFGSWAYTNAVEAGLDDLNSYYVVYQEGIYVGYRYYETRYEDYVMGTGNAGDYDYDADVAYAFGSGLSYTEFEWSNFSCTYDEATDTYVVMVTVTNAGDVAGKDVVEVYVQSPYTDYDVENGVEKASATLCGFGKTEELQPGESEVVTVTVDGEDIASYDAYGYGTYILDAGDYMLTAAEDAHAAVNNFLAAKGYTPDTTDGRMDDEGDSSLVYGWTEDVLDSTTYSVSSATGVAITNQFDDADLNLSEYVDEDQHITYLSRSDWEGTFPTEAVSLYATDAMVEELQYPHYDAETYDGQYADAEMPTTGADNGLSAMDLYGLDYDDELWDDLLDQLTVEDMAYLLGYAFHYTEAVESIDLVGTRNENGPQGLTTTLFGDWGDIADVATTGFSSEDVMAATWNTELMAEVGEVIGEDCIEAGVTYLYGPGANTHRTSYAGRNFEYFSEDGFLAGQLLLAECVAIEENGARVQIKHFALNDQETDRIGIGVWINEQALREVYLTAFEDAFTEGDCNGVMTSYTRVGLQWNGGDEGMIQGVLRDEWGCTGVTITDNSQVSNYYMDGADMVLAGGDLADAMGGVEYTQLLEYEDDPVVMTAMRESCHRVIYSIINSLAVNGMTDESSIKTVEPWYDQLAMGITAVGAIGFVVCLVFWIMRRSSYVNANSKPKKSNFAYGGVSETVDTVTDTVGGAVDTVTDAVGGAVDTVTDAAGKVVDTAGDVVDKAVDTVKDATSKK